MMSVAQVRAFVKAGAYAANPRALECGLHPVGGPTLGRLLVAVLAREGPTCGGCRFNDGADCTRHKNGVEPSWPACVDFEDPADERGVGG